MMACVWSSVGFQPEIEPSSLTKIKKAGAEFPFFCHLEERGAVEDDPGRISAFFVARRSWNRDNQRSGGAILVIEGGNTGPVVTHPDRAVGGDGHTPRVDQIWIDVGSDTGKVGLKIC